MKMHQLMQADKGAFDLTKRFIDDNKFLDTLAAFPGAKIAEDVWIVRADIKLYPLSFGYPLNVLKAIFFLIQLGKSFQHGFVKEYHTRHIAS